MGKRFNLLLIIFCAVILYSCYYYILPIVINLEFLKPHITNYIKNEYGYSIKVDKPNFKMGLSPSIWLKAEKFEILNDDKSIAMSINEPIIKIDLLPLIISHIEIRYFSAKNIFADLYYDNKRKVTLGQYVLLKYSNPVFRLNNSKILVDSVKINLNDKIKKENTTVFCKYFNIDEYKKNKSLKALINFEIFSGQYKSSVDLFADTKLPFNKHIDKYPPELSFSITNFSLSKFSNFINYFSNQSISDISGLVNLDIHSDKNIFDRKQYISTILIDNFYIKTKLFEKPYSYPHRILIKSNYLLENNDLIIPAFTVSTSKLNVKLSGSINKLSSKNPIPTLDLKLFNLNTEDILDILPFCSKFDNYIKISISELKKAKLKSNIDVNISIKDSIKKPSVYGKIDITNAYVGKPINNAPKNADIGIEFIKNKLRLNANIPTNISQGIKIQGDISLYGANNSNLSIETTDLIDLAELQRIVLPVQKVFNFSLGPVPIMTLSGFGSANLKFNGSKNNPHINGVIKTLKATAFFNGIPNLILKDAETILVFEDTNTIFTLKKGFIDGKQAFISGNCKLNGEFDYNIKLLGQDMGYLLNSFKTAPLLSNLYRNFSLIENARGLSDFNVNIKGHIIDINNIEFGKNIHVKGEIMLKSVNAKIVNAKKSINSIFGLIKFEDSAISLNLATYIKASKLELLGLINDNNANINFKLANAYLTDVINFLGLSDISVNKSKAKDYSTIELTGKYNGDISKFNINGLKMNGNIDFKNCNIIYNPYKMPITVHSGHLSMKNNYIFLSKLSAVLGTMPAVIGGQINNVAANSYFDLSVFARPNQKFLDYVYNSHSIYPIKLRGKSVVSGNLSGYKNKINIKSNINFDKGSSLYYMGATLGDEEQPLHFAVNSIIEPNKIYIKHFGYDKSNVPQVSLSGLIANKGDYTEFANLKINTFVPTDMKTFNIVFKKPFIKKGKFAANLVLNGTSKVPIIRGYLNLFDLDIPFINSTIKNISLKFTQNNIISTIKGSVLDNLFTLNIDAQNALKPPYVINSAKINSEKLDINTIYKAIKEFELDNSILETGKNISKFDLKQLIIRSFDISANNVLVNKITAKNLQANASLNNHKLKIDNFKFQMAEGQMDGSVSYNLDNFSSEFNLRVAGADSDVLLDTIFDLRGQMYGDIDGELNFTCIGVSQDKCIKTLNGRTVFRVKDGRMPKLGSLEYLLKAGNVMKSGITGLSMNGIMDFIVPLKTGSFDIIQGSVDINKGIMDKIQISTEGKDLNLFVVGEYDIASKFANMYVFGRLSRKISTILGPVGNLSLNTLFNTIPGVNLSKTSDTGLINNINKIPGLELSNKAYRVFAAEIHGDISGDEYVDSFRWIE